MDRKSKETRGVRIEKKRIFFLTHNFAKTMNALKNAIGEVADWFAERRPSWLTPPSERGPLRETALSKIALDTMYVKCERPAALGDCDAAFDNADWIVHIAPAHDWKLNNGDVSPMWLLAADLQSRFASSGSCLMAYVHTHCVERDVIRAHRIDNMSRTGEEKEGYDDLLVDDEFVMVFLWRADYENRIEHDKDATCDTLMRWRISVNYRFNKSRDVFVECPLVYDPKNLCITVDDQKLALEYGKAQAALSGSLDDGAGAVSAGRKLLLPLDENGQQIGADENDNDAESEEERRQATKED